MEIRKVIIVFLLLSVFTVGTLVFVDTVEAASWKKLGSGTFKDNNPGTDFEKTGSFISYSKGSKDIKMDFYIHPKKDKKAKSGTLFISKTGNKIKTYTVNFKGKKSKESTITYKGSVKEFYNYYISHLKKNGL